MSTPPPRQPSASPLVPAPIRPDFRAPSYSPGIPWKKVGALVVGFALLVGAYAWQQHRQKAMLRQRIARAYSAHVQPLQQQAVDFAARLPTWLRDATAQSPGAQAPGGWMDPSLDWTALHDVPVASLRMRVGENPTAEAFRLARVGLADGRLSDCLGLTAASLRNFDARSSFARPEWQRRALQARDKMRLRVFDLELQRRQRDDLPWLKRVLASRYLMLAVERGSDRNPLPVDVTLLRLSDGKVLLRWRGLNQGALLTARIATEQRRGAPVPQAAVGLSVDDCVLANELKSLTPAIAAAHRGE